MAAHIDGNIAEGLGFEGFRRVLKFGFRNCAELLIISCKVFITKQSVATKSIQKY